MLLKRCLFLELEHYNGTATTMKQKRTQHARIQYVSTTYKKEGFWSFIFKNKTNKETRKVSLCSPEYPGTHHKDQGCPELLHLPLPHPQLGLMVWTTTPSRMEVKSSFFYSEHIISVLEHYRVQSDPGESQ